MSKSSQEACAANIRLMPRTCPSMGSDDFEAPLQPQDPGRCFSSQITPYSSWSPCYDHAWTLLLDAQSKRQPEFRRVTIADHARLGSVLMFLTYSTSLERKPC